MNYKYWTSEEIISLPPTGNWFYGLVRDEEGKRHLSEIYPGMGYAADCWPRVYWFKNWYWVLRDIITRQRMK